MPHCFVKQPNGKYAIWSTIVDDFIGLDYTAAGALQEELNRPNFGPYPGGQGQYESDLRREIGNVEVDGRAWVWAPTWQECLKTVILFGNPHHSLEEVVKAGLATPDDLEELSRIVATEKAADAAAGDGGG